LIVYVVSFGDFYEGTTPVAVRSTLIAAQRRAEELAREKESHMKRYKFEWDTDPAGDLAAVLVDKSDGYKIDEIEDTDL